MEALQIIAHTPAGFASSDPWSPSIDGILAYWHVHEQMGDEAFALGQGRTDLMAPVTGLPVERVEWQDWWWYAVSAPLYQAEGMYQRYYHRRFDADQERYLEMAGRSSSRVQVNAGPYKNYRRSILIQQTPSVLWHVVGDAAETLRLLNRCTHIGHKTAQGCGRVARWEITPDGDASLPYHYRPVPVAYAEHHGLPTDVLMHWGLRPPGRLPENQCLCVMPH